MGYPWCLLSFKVFAHKAEPDETPQIVLVGVEMTGRPPALESPQVGAGEVAEDVKELLFGIRLEFLAAIIRERVSKRSELLFIVCGVQFFGHEMKMGVELVGSIIISVGYALLNSFELGIHLFEHN